MRIHFYEEFPTKDNLDRLGQVDFPCDIVLCAGSIDEFLGLEARVKRDFKQVKEIEYWPRLTSSEGYWASPLADRNALTRVIEDINYYSARFGRRLPVHWDAELPLISPGLFLKAILRNGLDFSRNKRKIKRFLNPVDRGFSLTSAEMGRFGMGSLVNKTFESLGIGFDPKEYDSRQVRFWYTSISEKMLGRKISNNILRREAEFGVRNYGRSFALGIGCIAPGIYGNEPILSNENLVGDLEIAKRAKVSDIYVFRLGGLNKDRAEIIRSYNPEI